MVHQLKQFVLLLALSSLPLLGHAGVTIFDYDAEIENNVVSTVTKGSVNLVPGTRRQDNPWAANECFELQFSSPYDDFGAYKPFADGTTTCSTDEPGFKVVCQVD